MGRGVSKRYLKDFTCGMGSKTCQSMISILKYSPLWTKWKLGKAPNIFFSIFSHELMSVEEIEGCFSFSVVLPLILLPNYSKFEKITLSRLLGSKWNLGMASNKLSSSFCHQLMSMEVIKGCFSVVLPLILILLRNFSKLEKMTPSRLLRSKWNLGMASNIFSSPFCQGLRSVEDIRGCFSSLE